MRQKCANRGALANHVNFAHTSSTRMNSVSRYVIPKPKKSGFSFQSLIVSSLAMHVISSASRLVTVPFLHPIFRPASPPECSKNEGLFKIAANAPKRRLFKIQPSAPKFLSVEEALVDKYMEQRKQGKRVSALWFKKTAKIIAREQNIEGFEASKDWFFLFLRHYNLILRKKTNSKKCSVEQIKPVIAVFYRNLRIFLST